MDDTIRFPASLEIRAADGKQPTFKGVVYSGGPMRISDFGQVVVDVQGAGLAESVPVLVDHGESIDHLVGQAQAIAQNGAIAASGTLTTATEAGQKVVAIAKSGVKLQVSIGFQPDRREFIQAGKTITVNLQTIVAGDGGLTVVRSGKLREISLVPIGADPNTNISIAASGRIAAHLKGRNMDFDTWLQTKGFDPNTVTTPQRASLQAAYQAETTGPAEMQRRYEALNAKFSTPRLTEHTARVNPDRLVELRATAFAEQWDEIKTEMELLRAERDSLALERIRRERPQFPTVYSSGPQTGDRDTIEAALMLHIGQERTAEKTFQAPVLERARGVTSQ